MRLLLDHVNRGRERAEAGEIRLGNTDAWVAWNLTGGAAHVTDILNASRTQLLGLEAADWDDELLGIFGIPRAALPELVLQGVRGHGGRRPLPRGADRQPDRRLPRRALWPGRVSPRRDQGHVRHGSTMHADSRPRPTPPTAPRPPWPGRAAAGRPTPSKGTSSPWGRGAVGGRGRGSTTRRAVSPSSLTGSRTRGRRPRAGLRRARGPRWDDAARGSSAVSTRGTTAADPARATLASIAHQVRDVFDLMQAEAGVDLEMLLADGGDP